MSKIRKQAMTPEAIVLVAERFKAMSEPIRLQILQELESGEMSVTDIAAAVESTQPNVSKHLKILQETGLLARRQAGNTVYYSIADQIVFEICQLVCKNLHERFATKAANLKGKTTRKAKGSK